MSNFMINDLVKITDTGCIYPGYVPWAKAHMLNNWRRNNPLENEIFFKIVALGQHSTNRPETIYGIQHIATENQYIIGGRGLELAILSEMKHKEPQINTENYPNKCPLCNWSSYNFIFIGKVECTNSNCQNYKG